jgi:hypothetical protein
MTKSPYRVRNIGAAMWQHRSMQEGSMAHISHEKLVAQLLLAWQLYFATPPGAHLPTLEKSYLFLYIVWWTCVLYTNCSFQCGLNKGACHHRKNKYFSYGVRWRWNLYKNCCSRQDLQYFSFEFFFHFKLLICLKLTQNFCSILI